MAGQDVKALQELLNQLNFDLSRYGADGDFGSETEAAVKSFPKKAGVKVDGKYGNETHKALIDAVADDDEGQNDADDGAQPVKTVRITAGNGGKVNIRMGNGTNYGRITSVASGTALPYIATAANGWHAVVINDRIGWVSGKYSKIA